MRHRNDGAAAMLFLVFISLASAGTAAAQYGVIYNFELSHGDPVHPAGTLRTDAKGTLFGTAGDGSTFELKLAEHGGWTVNKTPNGPGGSEWIPDANGNYFTSQSSGGPAYAGTIIESSPARNGSWTQKVIYNFGSFSTDGIAPSGSLVFDVEGNLYGTTLFGGTNGTGTVFELTRSAGGNWAEKILYNFGPSGSTDGAQPQGLTIDADGNLYGTSATGGPDYYNYYDYSDQYPIQGGTVFELTRQSSGVWKENILVYFTPSTLDGFYYQSDGAWDPAPGLFLDNKGNLYGTTNLGVTYNGSGGPSNTSMEGTVFELSPGAAGQWTQSFFYLYCQNQSDCYVDSPLTMDSAGHLYGTTAGGGSNLGVDNGTGDTVYSVNLGPLYNFPSTATDGRPSGGVILSNGNLFGVTADGGPDMYGTAYEIQGVANATPVETTTTLETNPSSSFTPGEKITLTATVTSATGSLIPVGTVKFVDAAEGCNSGLSATELLVAGKALYSGLVPRAGNYSVKACYSGGFGFVQSESSTISAAVQ